MSQDYYDLLGVDRDADEATLKRAYRKSVMDCHPDRNPGDKEAEEKFKSLSKAYDTLRNPQSRKIYDSHGEEGLEGGGHSFFSDIFGEQGFRSSFSTSGFSGFGSLFRNIFTGGRSSRREDVHYSVEISLEESYLGKSLDIPVKSREGCVGCGGEGVRHERDKVPCEACGGRGVQRLSSGNFMLLEQTCSSCQGKGWRIKNPCGQCHGAGYTEKTSSVHVQIPPGILNGTHLKLPYQEEASDGHFYLSVTVLPHDFFQTNETHLYCTVTIPFSKAILGGEVSFPYLNGDTLKIKVPPGTQPMQKIRLKRRGLPIIGSGGRFGDLYVTLEVVLPKTLTPKQKEALEIFQ